MDTDQVQPASQSPQGQGFSNFWQSVVIVGIIFGVVSFVLGLFFGYRQISSEPTGTIFSPMMISGVVVCLITCLAGAVSVWHYTKEVTQYIKLGQGALVGFLTGAVIVVISVVLNEIWMLIDPDYTEKLIESAIANVEAMDLPQSTRDDMADAMAESVRTSQSVARQLFWGIPVTGLLNMVTGMIATAIFGKKEEEESF
jgi:hypothetical protein